MTLSLHAQTTHTRVSGCLDSLERGTMEWNSGTVEWNSGMVERWNSGMGNYD